MTVDNLDFEEVFVLNHGILVSKHVLRIFNYLTVILIKIKVTSFAMLCRMCLNVII